MSAIDFFPYDAFRPHQREVIEQVAEGLFKVNYIFLEAPTGLGKSAVGYTIAKWVQNMGELSHIVVNDIYLQDQYTKDFKDLTLIKGRGNYSCSFSENKKADKGYCTFNRDYVCSLKPKISLEKDMYGVIFDWDGVTTRCPYWAAKDEAIHAPITIQNYAYFLNEQNYAKCFTQRYFGVFDEAHTIESEIMKFVAVSITQGRIDYFWSTYQHGGSPKLPPLSAKAFDDADRWLDWIRDLYGGFESLKVSDLKQVPKIPDETQQKILSETETYKDRLKTLIEYLTGEPENWAVVREEKAVTFKPVTVNDHAYLLFNHTKKHLLMSATILNVDNLKRWLGIKEEVIYIRISESNFPPQNRPIIRDIVGKANKDNMPMYLPRVLQELDDKIIPPRIQFKGVIHTHTNDTANYILKNSKYHDIMMSNVGHEDRADMFQRFFNASAPRIMVTPSMRLGVDLKDDLARWQVIVKMPYPYLGDPQIRKRLHRDPEWYNWQTLVSLIQTCGRICRSETDWGNTYILDGKFDDLIERNRNILPRWFSEAIIGYEEPSI